MRARDNPFATHRVLAVRYRLQGISWPELVERFAGLGSRAALVGPEGSGKTTLLEDLGERLAGQGFRLRPVTLVRGQSRLPPAEEESLLADLDATDLLLIDGADQLGHLSWRRLRRRSRAAGGLLVTSHRTGLLPTLHRCVTTPELLAELVREILSGEEPAVDPRALFTRHRGNLRTALRELYDLYAGR